MISSEATAAVPLSEFEVLQGAERALKKALSVVDWYRVPVVFSREEAKAVLSLVSEEVQDRSRTTLICDECIPTGEET